MIQIYPTKVKLPFHVHGTPSATKDMGIPTSESPIYIFEFYCDEFANGTYVVPERVKARIALKLKQLRLHKLPRFL